MKNDKNERRPRKEHGRDDLHGMHGEGNPAADRRYRESAREFIEEGRVEDAAEEAREAMEGPDAESLRRAERRGKARAREEDR